MFDTLSGLPVHVLVVHGAVVLLPLMAVVTSVVAVRPRWRTRANLVGVVVADAVVAVLTFVAKESGEKLQARLSQVEGGEVAEEHSELGDVLPLFALALLLVAVVLLVLVHRQMAALAVNVAIGLTIVVALASVGWTIAVGHSGAEAAWKDTIANTSAPTGD